MLRDAIHKMRLHEHLSEVEMMACMEEMVSGKASDSLIASFLTAMTMKGETIEEITGGARVLREKSIKINLEELNTLDTCGTGGDEAGTYNISTAVSFITAAAGIPVVKHGNRSVSSKSGSADVLEALGVNIHLTPEQSEKMVRDIGMCFLFAPKYHQAMKHVACVRKELGFRTIFNILGPLVNPAHAKTQVLGVFDDNLSEKMAYVLKHLGVKRALVVHGKDGLDELTITCNSKITELNENGITSYDIQPEQYGLKKGKIEDIKGGSAKENAEIIKALLLGEKGSKRDILVLNAGAGIYTAGKADSIQEGIRIAEQTIDSHQAINKLVDFIRYSNSISQ